MPISISTPDAEPFFDQTIELDGTDYVLSFAWNQRESRYYVSILTPEGEDLVRGQACVCMWKLFMNRVDEFMPPGMLIIIPFGDNNSPPGIGELGPGKRCELWYYAASELA